MADISQLCERLLIIDRGRLLYDGALETIRERYGQERMLVVDFVSAGGPVQVPHATVERVDGPRQWLRFRREETTAVGLDRRARRALRATGPDD